MAYYALGPGIIFENEDELFSRTSFEDYLSLKESIQSCDIEVFKNNKGEIFLVHLPITGSTDGFYEIENFDDIEEIRDTFESYIDMTDLNIKNILFFYDNEIEIDNSYYGDEYDENKINDLVAKYEVMSEYFNK